MIGLDGVSAQELSDTIGEIYDCALDPQRWPNTCQRIADLCESTAGGICVHDMRHVQNDQLFVFGYQHEFLEGLGKHYAQNPMAIADIVANVGDVNALSNDSGPWLWCTPGSWCWWLPSRLCVVSGANSKSPRRQRPLRSLPRTLFTHGATDDPPT
jgi:hypothetical protein